MSAPPSDIFIMFSTTFKAVNKRVNDPAVCPTFDRSQTYLLCFKCACREFYCYLHIKYLQNKLLEYKMPKRKGGKVLYNATEAGEMIWMNSDSEGDNIDLGEDLEHLQMDSDHDQ